MKALRLPTPHPGRFWFATGFRAALHGSCSPKRSRADGGAARAWAVWSAGGPVPAGVRVDLGHAQIAALSSCGEGGEVFEAVPECDGTWRLGGGISVPAAKAADDPGRPG